MDMMKNILAIGILSYFFLTGASSPRYDVKIGIIDLQKILEYSKAGMTAQVEINKKGKQMESDLKDKSREIEAIEKMMERDSLIMSKDLWEEKQRERRIKVGDFKTLRQKYLEDFKALENRITSRIQKEIVALVQDVGKKEGYAMIVEKRVGGVFYSPLSMDITDSVIQIYNTRFAKSEFNKNFDTVWPDLDQTGNLQAKAAFPGLGPENGGFQSATEFSIK